MINLTLISETYKLYHNLESEYIIGLPTEETNHFQTKHIIPDTMLMLFPECHETMKIILALNKSQCTIYLHSRIKTSRNILT